MHMRNTLPSVSRNVVVLLVAGLLLVLSVGTGATAALVITGKQIKDNSVTGKDIKNRSLTAKDLSSKAKKKLRGQRGATGPAGPAGPQGETGLPGISEYEVVSGTKAVDVASLTPTQLDVACPAGKQAIAASGGTTTLVTNLVTQVSRTSATGFDVVALPTTLVGLLPNTLTLDVVCAKVAG